MHFLTPYLLNFKGERYYSQNGKNLKEKGNTCREQDLLIKCPIEVPNLGYSLSMWVCLSSGYTMLGLLCRSKYCCSKFINLGTRFAGHSYKKSSKGELLHRLVRLERGTNLLSNQRT